METSKPTAGWTTLPDELICNILKLLPFNDLSACQALDQRTARVIRNHLLLPCAYWRKFIPSPSEHCYSKEQYKEDFRQWFLEAGRDDQVIWLDSLQAHRNFPKALFFAIFRAFDQAENWQLVEKKHFWDSSCDKLLAISPDGTTLILNKQNLPHIVTIETIDVKEEYQISIGSMDTDDHPQCVFGDHCLVIYRYAEIIILDRSRGRWEEVFRNKFDEFTDDDIPGIQFSANDEHLSIASIRGNIRVLECGDGRWHQKTAFEFHGEISDINFLLKGRGLMIRSPDSSCHFLHFENGRYDQKYCVNLDDNESSLIVSPRGDSAVLWDSGALIIDCIDDKWTNTCTLQPAIRAVEYSPDGLFLATLLDKILNDTAGFNERAQILGSEAHIWNFKGGNWVRTYVVRMNMALLPTTPRFAIYGIMFSPDSSRLLAFKANNPFLYMDFVDGNWHATLNCGPQDYLNDTDEALFSSNSLVFLKGLGCDKRMQVIRFKEGLWVEALASEFHTEAIGFNFSYDGRKLFMYHSSDQKEVSVYEIIPKAQKAKRLENADNPSLDGY